MNWYEPENCTTERGWLYADADEHPDGADDYASHAIGNYLYYPDDGTARTNVGYHICAYLIVKGAGGTHTRHADIPPEARWYPTRALAKAAVERFAATLLPRVQHTLAL